MVKSWEGWGDSKGVGMGFYMPGLTEGWRLVPRPIKQCPIGSCPRVTRVFFDRCDPTGGVSIGACGVVVSKVGGEYRRWCSAGIATDLTKNSFLM